MCAVLSLWLETEEMINHVYERWLAEPQSHKCFIQLGTKNHGGWLGSPRRVAHDKWSNLSLGVWLKKKSYTKEGVLTGDYESSLSLLSQMLLRHLDRC